MLQLRENETVLLVVRKHWFLMLAPLLIFILLLFVPPVILILLPLIPNLDFALIQPVVHFALSLYMMVLFLYLFLLWTIYYLDMWIITTTRIIDIEQQGLFSREISEIPLNRVQDITIEIRGIFETFLKFGTIHIQTAGEREFFISGVAHLYEIKDLILKYSQAAPTPPVSPHPPELSH